MSTTDSGSNAQQDTTRRQDRPRAKVRRRWVWPTLTMAAVLLLPVAAVAGARFDDVRSGQTHEEAIGWVADAGVTQGCDPAGDNYCPEDAVTRAQMASFMRRLAGHDPAVAPSVNAQTLDGQRAADLIEAASDAPRRSGGLARQGNEVTITQPGEYTLANHLGTFTKERSDTRLEVTFSTHVRGTGGPSWAACNWQLRIDGRNANNALAVNGPQRHDPYQLHTGVSPSDTPLMFSVEFSGVGAGPHDLELWVDGAGADSCFHNPGNYNRRWRVVEY